MFNPELSQALRAARENVGLTQVEAAKRTSIERGWLNSVEGGKIIQPNLDRLKQLASLYGVHPDVFLKLAHYDVDEVTMPKRKLSDLALELFTKLKEFEDSEG